MPDTKPKVLSKLQIQLLERFETHTGLHYLGPDLAKYYKINTRTLRQAIRSLRYDFDRWDILSKPGDNRKTDGYWLSKDAAEIEKNRQYHERQGRDHLSRASHMSPTRSPIVDQKTGQNLMEFGK